MEKTFIFNGPDKTPNKEYDGAQYLLFIDWLPPEERDENYKPDYFIGFWEEGKWWIPTVGYERENDTQDGDLILRPIDFSPIPEWNTLLGWAPLF